VVELLPDAEIDWQDEVLAILGDLVALVDPRPRITTREFRKTNVSWNSRRGTKVQVELEPPRDVLLVRTLPTAALVIAHAKMGTRPDWVPEAPRPRMVPALKGNGPAIIGERRGRNWYSTGSCCPLVWEPSPIAIAQLRADYLAWWRGLRTLSHQLLFELERYNPLPPAAPEMPWGG